MAKTCVLFICFAISSSEMCLCVSKTESYGLSRICFEMTRQAIMPSLLEKCLRISKTESYGLSRICFEMTRQAIMPSSSEKCLCVSKTEIYGLSRICFEMTRQVTMPSSKAWLCLADEQHNGVVFHIIGLDTGSLVLIVFGLSRSSSRWKFTRSWLRISLWQLPRSSST
jgi:hypothetical protein